MRTHVTWIEGRLSEAARALQSASHSALLKSVTTSAPKPATARHPWRKPAPPGARRIPEEQP